MLKLQFAIVGRLGLITFALSRTQNPGQLNDRGLTLAVVSGMVHGRVQGQTIPRGGDSQDLAKSGKGA